MLRTSGKVSAGVRVTKMTLSISSNLTPSFRLIGYYYNHGGDIIADSVWVDVKDECEGKVSSGFKYLLRTLLKIGNSKLGEKRKGKKQAWI